ncbi:hypothetical protein AB0E69_06680 [Kribbella sp. NPDC026611]|uniref:hypothetical protein n=1 Tax=Kribbella sp. NPDC026611 TaxID=3154911 RepID=UPI0033CACEF3
MNDLLKDTLTWRAETTEPAPLDLDALIDAGRRRSRRRRFTIAATTTVVALAALATGFTAVRAIGNDPGPAGRSAPYTEHRPTYAIGNVIHYGKDTIRAAGKVTAMAQTDAGLVYATGEPDHPGEVTLLDGSGKHVLGGRTQYPSLISDGHSVIAWFEEEAAGAPSGRYVVYDVSQHSQLLQLPLDTKTTNVTTIDRGFVYVMATTRLDRIDLRTGKRSQVRDTQGRSPVDISGRNYLLTEPAGPAWALFLGDLLGPGHQRVAGGLPTWVGGFAPDGKHAVVGPDDEGVPAGRLQVNTVPAGKELSIGSTAYRWQRFAGWLDNDRFTMVAAKDRTWPADLLTCSIAAANCTVTKPNVAPSESGIVYLSR